MHGDPGISHIFDVTQFSGNPFHGDPHYQTTLKANKENIFFVKMKSLKKTIKSILEEQTFDQSLSCR